MLVWQIITGCITIKFNQKITRIKNERFKPKTLSYC
jgi:hypothetical protein